jgi:hypothetical protein
MEMAADVKFSPDGKKIAVTLWGISFLYAKTNSKRNKT